MLEKTSRKEKLQILVERALNSQTAAAIVRKYNLDVQKTIVNSKLEKTAWDTNVRVKELEDRDYILCPIPYFYDDVKNLEAGFLLDVDENNFEVFTYVKKNLTEEFKFHSKLPHCVFSAIQISSKDYRELKREEVEVKLSEDRALLFMNSLFNDLATGLDSPIDFFDDELYRQLIVRLSNAEEDDWCVSCAFELRLKHLINNYENLEDEYKQLYEDKFSLHVNNLFTNYRYNISDDVFKILEPYSSISGMKSNLNKIKIIKLVNQMKGAFSTFSLPY